MNRRLIDATDCAKDLQFIRGHNNNAYWQMACDYLINKVDVMPTIKAVELPCKNGDKVWIARRYKCHKRPRWGIVSEMFFTNDMELCIVVKGVARGKWGVDVFATYEEAEKQIEINNRKD